MESLVRAARTRKASPASVSTSPRPGRGPVGGACLPLWPAVTKPRPRRRACGAAAARRRMGWGLCRMGRGQARCRRLETEKGRADRGLSRAERHRPVSWPGSGRLGAVGTGAGAGGRAAHRSSVFVFPLCRSPGRCRAEMDGLFCASVAVWPRGRRGLRTHSLKQLRGAPGWKAVPKAKSRLAVWRLVLLGKE